MAENAADDWKGFYGGLVSRCRQLEGERQHGAAPTQYSREQSFDLDEDDNFKGEDEDDINHFLGWVIVG